MQTTIDLHNGIILVCVYACTHLFNINGQSFVFYSTFHKWQNNISFIVCCGSSLWENCLSSDGPIFCIHMCVLSAVVYTFIRPNGRRRPSEDHIIISLYLPNNYNILRLDRHSYIVNAVCRDIAKSTEIDGISFIYLYCNSKPLSSMQMHRNI